MPYPTSHSGRLVAWLWWRVGCRIFGHQTTIEVVSLTIAGVYENPATIPVEVCRRCHQRAGWVDRHHTW